VHVSAGFHEESERTAASARWKSEREFAHRVCATAAVHATSSGTNFRHRFPFAARALFRSFTASRSNHSMWPFKLRRS
jgi:hypothetical protein